MTELARKILRVERGERLATGVREVWYMPDGTLIPAIVDKPIPPGTYFLRPDDTGRWRHWVFERELGSRVAVPAQFGDGGVVVVPPRTDVEVHPGEDLDDTEGCVCPGLRITPSGVTDTVDAIALMRLHLRRDAPDPPIWILEIVE